MEAEVCPKCPACREDYDLHTRLPLLLPCCHAICSACVESRGGRVTCPTCSKVKVLSWSEELPRDVCTVNEVILARLPSLPCGQCEVEGHVTHRCTMCRSLLCQDCVTQHARMKVFSKHRPLPLSSSLQLRQQFFQEMELCQDGNSPSGFCWKCSSILCSECTHDHKGSGHDYVTLEHAQNEAHAEHEQLLKELDARHRKLENLCENAIAVNSKNKDHLEECGSRLLEIRNQLLRAVNARCDQLQAQLQGVAQVQASRQEHNMAALGQSLAEVENSAGYLARTAVSTQPLQVLTLHRALTSSLRQLLASPVCPPDLDLQSCKVKVETTDLQGVLDLIGTVGDVTEGLGDVELKSAKKMSSASQVDVNRTLQISTKSFQTGSEGGISARTMTDYSSSIQSTDTAKKCPQSRDIVKTSVKSPDPVQKSLGSTDTAKTCLKSPDPVQKSLQSADSFKKSLQTTDTFKKWSSAATSNVLPSTGNQGPKPNVFTKPPETRTKPTNIRASFSSMAGARRGLRAHATEVDPAFSSEADDDPHTENGERQSLEFCSQCINEDDFSIRGKVLVNRPGTGTRQEGRLHTHCPHPRPWNLGGRPPRCYGLRRYWGTMGNQVLCSGFLTWTVKVRIRSDDVTSKDNSYLFEVGVVPPDKCDVSSQALGGRGSKGCGLEVIYCVSHKGLCAKARDSEEKVSKHTPLGVRLVQGSVVETQISLTVNTSSGTLDCRSASSREDLCHFQGVHPPLLLFFGLRSGTISPRYSLEMELVG